MPGHLHLKERKEGQQNRSDLLYRDFKAELLEKEKTYFRTKDEKIGIFKSDDVPITAIRKRQWRNEGREGEFAT